MKSPKTNNTKERGVVEFLIMCEEGNDKFIGVCLTFNILQEGDDPMDLLQELREAAKLHVETVIEKNLPDTLLNRPAPKKYWDLYSKARSLSAGKKGQVSAPITLSTLYPDFLGASINA